MTERDMAGDFCALKKQFRKSFSVLNLCVKSWQEVESSSTKHISKLANLCEQYQCCSRATNLPIEQVYPDIKDRLLYKISLAMEEECQMLKAQVSTLETCSLRMENQYKHCMACYETTTGIADLPHLVKGTPLSPALSDMLEWTECSQRLLRQSYLCKKVTLESFSPHGERCVEMLETAWSSGDRGMMDKLQDYLAYTSEFLEEEIT